MRLIGKILLTVLAIPVLILCALSVNIRFQLLSSAFWSSAFEKGNVYAQISQSIVDKLVKNVVAEGGSKSDIGDLSQLVSPDSIKSFADKNIASFLDFANGKSSDITVHIPFLSNQTNFTGDMTLSEFLDEYNVTSVSESDIQIISNLGKWSWFFTAGSFGLLLILIVLSYLLTVPGKHLTASGLMFILPGALLISAYFLGNFAAGVLTRDFTASNNPATSFAAIAALPVIAKIAVIWAYFGLSAFLLGIILFFIKKPAINKS